MGTRTVMLEHKWLLLTIINRIIIQTIIITNQTFIYFSTLRFWTLVLISIWTRRIIPRISILVVVSMPPLLSAHTILTPLFLIIILYLWPIFLQKVIILLFFLIFIVNGSWTAVDYIIILFNLILLRLDNIWE